MLGKKKPGPKLFSHKMVINLQILSPFMENGIMGDVENNLIIAP